MNPFLDFRPPIPAAQGIQGNPIGAFPVSTYSTNRLGQSTYNWDAVQAGGNSIFKSVTACTHPNCSNVARLNLFSVKRNFPTPDFYNYKLPIEKGVSKFSLFPIRYAGTARRKLKIVS